jgi:Family of unknown function (DUF5681)
MSMLDKLYGIICDSFGAARAPARWTSAATGRSCRTPRRCFGGSSSRTPAQRFGEATPEPLPDAPAGASPSASPPNSALSAPAVGEEAPAAAPVLDRSADHSAQKQRGRPFQPGQSGNPNGRPKGARNRVTRAVEALIDGQGEALGAKAVEKALQGIPPCCAPC